MPTIRANGVRLYHDVRGSGPPVLFIMGATGDAGHFTKVADLLSDEFTVITYDRRGTGRSPRPPGWTVTSPEEQAADAAGLLRALGVDSAVVFGTSSGAVFALCMVVRHPRLVRGCVLHEPTLPRLFDDPDVIRRLTALLADARAEGGSALAVERFWRIVAGDAAWDQLESAVRDRIMATADTLLDVEFGNFEDYLPSDAEFAQVTLPVHLMVSEDGRPGQHQAAARLAARLAVQVRRVPGTHVSYWDHPAEFCAALRPLLRRGPGLVRGEATA
jgi:pimeloyl-ACP methyl ester carboxylesterase